MLDLALHYGHCGVSTPFDHSASLDIEIERGSSLSASSIKASEYLRIPSIHRASHGIPDGLHLSHLCCDRDHPERVQTILSLSLQAQLIRRRYDAPSAHRHAKSGLNAIGEANVRLLDHFVASAELPPI